MRFLLWLLTHTHLPHPHRGPGKRALPRPGAAGLEPHVARGWLSGRRLRAALHPLHGVEAVLRAEGAELVLPHDQRDSGRTGNRREMVESIRAARRELEAGHVVCIFAEGAISRTGNMLPFKRGMEKIVEGLDVPVIPVHLDRLWGSIFSFERGRFFWKWPKRIPYPVTVSFGAPMPATTTAHEVRQAIQELVERCRRRTARPPAIASTCRLIRNARRHWNHFAMADSTGRELTYGRMLTGGVLVARWMRRQRRGRGDDRRAAAAHRGRRAGEHRRHAGRPRPGEPELHRRPRRHGRGRRAVRASAPSSLRSCSWPRPRSSAWKAWSSWKTSWPAPASWTSCARSLAARFMPARSPGRPRPRPRFARHRDLLQRQHRRPQGRDALALQRDRRTSKPSRSSSGSASSDRIVGVLPFFHSFGFTVTIWFPLIAGCGVVYHPNPTDARAIGELVAEIQRHAAALHADLLLRLHAQVQPARSSPACASCWSARRNCASRWPRRSTRSSASSCWKATAAPRCRRWSP